MRDTMHVKPECDPRRSSAPGSAGGDVPTRPCRLDRQPARVEATHRYRVPTDRSGAWLWLTPHHNAARRLRRPTSQCCFRLISVAVPICKLLSRTTWAYSHRATLIHVSVAHSCRLNRHTVLSLYPRSRSISWRLPEGYRNGDHRRRM